MTTSYSTSYTLWGLSRCYLALYSWSRTIGPNIKVVGLAKFCAQVWLWKFGDCSQFGTTLWSFCASQHGSLYSPQHYCLWEFHKICNFGTVVDKDEIVLRFWGQKIKGRGYDETKYCQKICCSKMRLSSKWLMVCCHRPRSWVNPVGMYRMCIVPSCDVIQVLVMMAS